MMKKLIFLSLLFCYSAFAQQRICGSYDVLQQQLASDPALKERMQQIENQTAAYLASHPNGSGRTLVTIPVVFHVVYSTTAMNLSDAQCQAQLNQLNLDYARLNTDASSTPAAFTGVAANTNIQFCMAQRTPAGVATTGVERRNTTVASWTTNDNVKHYSSGGLDAWDATKYLNIWSCNLGSGLLGYAQFPGGSASTDGVVLLYSSIGSMLSPGTATPYQLGRTATHEVGHWLNLYHIWGDDGSACSGTDNVSDTPNQGPENYGCPVFPHTDACSPASPGVMFMNYMDYTDDACMNMFTSGQSSRMAALFGTGGARVGLLTSLGCQAVTGGSCGTPTGLTATSITTTSATLGWTAVTGAVSYNVQYKLSTSGTWTTTTSTTNSKVLTGLSAASTYNYQIQAVCTNAGAYSAVASFTTAASSNCGADAYEVNNTMGSGISMVSATTYNALICPSGDEDWFKFINTTASPHIKVTLSSLPADYDCYIYNSAGTLVASGTNGGTTTETVKYNNGAIGTYYIRIIGYSGAYNSSTSYSLKAQRRSTAWRLMEGASPDEDAEDLVITHLDGNDMLLMPVPATDWLNIDYLSFTQSSVVFKVYDLSGRIITTEKFESQIGVNEFKLDMTPIENGMYMLELTDGETRIVKPFTVQR